tara:strand:+ start:10053 stop:11318 length:1266 start_codon:yes stop_codon:yes gene_type:complete
MKELIIDIFKYGWKPAGGAILGVVIVVWMIRKGIEARKRRLRALERAKSPGPMTIGDLDFELEKRDKSRPKDSRDIDLPKRREKTSKSVAKEEENRLGSELDSLLDSSRPKKRKSSSSNSSKKSKRKPSRATSQARESNSPDSKSSEPKRKATRGKTKKKSVTKEELKRSLKEELKAELRAELRSELRAEIELEKDQKISSQTSDPPTQHGESGATDKVDTVNPAPVDRVRPDRPTSIVSSTPQDLEPKNREAAPSESTAPIPTIDSTQELAKEPEPRVNPNPAPSAPLLPKPLSPAPLPSTPTAAKPAQPSPTPTSNTPKPPVAANASPVATSPTPVRPATGTPAPAPVEVAAPAPAPAPKGFLEKFFRPKDPREHIGERLAIKRGRLKGRYGTVVSIEGNVVTISDKSGKITTVDATDF